MSIDLKDFLFKEEFVEKPSKILVRIDLNGAERGGYKFWRNAKEIKETYSKLAKENSVVLITHWGRRGRPDFRENLSFIAKLLEKETGLKINYIDALMGDFVLKSINKPGIYLLKNLRASDYEKGYEIGKENELVKFFAGNFDIYINDAPSVAHRAHASVMLPLHMERSYVGKIFVEEIEKMEEVAKLCKLLVWGGAKPDKVKYVEKLLANGWTVLLGGVPAVEFNRAKKGEDNQLKALLKFSNVFSPVDFVIDVNGKIVDIGEKTLQNYIEILEKNKGGAFSGPMGIYEIGYIKSSLELMKRCKAVLGGHSGNIAFEHGLRNVLISGGAALAYFANGTLPGIEAFKLREK